MAHLDPVEEHRRHGPAFEQLQERADRLGFTPNALLIMGRRPAVLKAFMDLADSIYAAEGLPGDLKRLAALVRSVSSGCQYCAAHTSSWLAEHGVSAEKTAAVWDFETSDAFHDGERAALRLARDAAHVPNGVTEQHFMDLREHYDEDQIAELVAMVSLFAFLNSWNDTLATTLEDHAKDLAASALGDRWSPGKHT